MREYIVRGRDLVLGSEQIPHPITALAAVSKGKSAKSDLSGIVGIEALKRYVVTLDFPGKLFLKPYSCDRRASGDRKERPALGTKHEAAKAAGNWKTCWKPRRRPALAR